MSNDTRGAIIFIIIAVIAIALLIFEKTHLSPAQPIKSEVALVSSITGETL